MKSKIAFVILLGISAQVLSLNLADIDLETPLPAFRGFQITGAHSGDAIGFEAEYAGDVNGDGIDDFIFSTQQDVRYTSNLASTGACVIYGKEGEGPGNIDLLQGLSSDQGFKISAQGVSLTGISSAGDVNGDGIDDLIFSAGFGAPFGRRSAGIVYVLYGRAGGFQANIDVNVTYDLTQGFQIYGVVDSDLGLAISSARDVNGDGIDDIIVSAPYASTNGRQNNGAVYVIYGKAGGLNGHIDLANPLDLAQGFQISGNSTNDFIGFTSVNWASDVNGDGVDDVMLGSYAAAPLGNQYIGAVYVIYGRFGGLQAHIDLNTWTLSQGFLISGSQILGYLGYTVSSAGDFNADGIADLLLSEAMTAPFGRPRAGTVYIIYGRAGGFQSHVDLATPLSLSEGVTIAGDVVGLLGYAMSYLGDINQDGVDDVFIGSGLASPYDREVAGHGYVIYGKAGGLQTNLDVLNLENNTYGFQIAGGFENDRVGISLSYGDINNDGANDLILGAYLFDKGAYTAGSTLVQDTGAVYIIYSGIAIPFNLLILLFIRLSY